MTAGELNPDTIAKAEWFAITHCGGLAFRFGPFTGPEIGQIMTQCLAENIELLVTGNCGTPFDWDLARGMCRRSSGPTFGDLSHLIQTTAAVVREGLREPRGTAEEVAALQRLESALQPFEVEKPAAALSNAEGRSV